MRVNSGIFARRTQEPATLHVRMHARGWCVTTDEDSRPLSVHATFDDAVSLAQALARRGARVVVHDGPPSAKAG